MDNSLIQELENEEDETREFLFAEQTFRHPCLIGQTSLEKFITRSGPGFISKMQTRDKVEEKRDLNLKT